MRSYDPPEVFQETFAGCAVNCGSAWTKICKGCNLAYCGAHVDYEPHKCQRLDLARGGVERLGPPASDIQLSLEGFPTAAPANGNGEKEKTLDILPGLKSGDS
jgi:hypothetical protein